MGRDPLRQLEDHYIRVEQAKRDGKILVSLDLGMWIIRHLIRMQKEINELKEKQ